MQDLTFTEITVDPLDRDAVTLSWSYESPILDPTDWTFRVERSESRSGPYVTVGPVLSVPTFTDRVGSFRSRNRTYFWRVRAQHVASADIVSDPVTNDYPADLILLEIIRRHTLFLRRFVGRDVAFFKERTTGQRCPICWDAIRQRVTRSGCERCFATGFLHGYYPQQNCQIALQPSVEAPVMQILGEAQPGQTYGWTVHIPKVKARDVFVEKTGRRWVVVNRTATERRGSTSRQTFLLREINPSDPEFRVPVTDPTLADASKFIGFYPDGGSGLL